MTSRAWLRRGVWLTLAEQNQLRSTLEFAAVSARINEATLVLRYMPHTLDCKEGKCVHGAEPCLRPRQIARILRLKQQLDRILERKVMVPS